MTTPEFLERHAALFAASGRVGFVVVDEAHHVGLARASHRPAYARLGEALETLGHPVVCAVTATASDEVAATIRETLGIEAVVLDPTRRDNLRVADRRGLADKPGHLAALAASGEKLIVYVNSREQSVRIAQRIRESSPRLAQRTAFYNGGMARAARHAVERAFRDGDITAVVATSAFGEGVNIPDVRNVALFHLPFNRVEFNQMCGRVGRDGRARHGPPAVRRARRPPQRAHPRVRRARPRRPARALRGAAVARGRPVGRLDRGHQRGAGRGREAHASAEPPDRPRRVHRHRGLPRGRARGGRGAGSYRRLTLLPVDGKVDLTSSVRYAEGVEEAEEFAGFRAWVLGAPADELLAAFDRPILPDASSARGPRLGC